jgi:glycine/D-amino acid oxidase-like deaminating enzyme
MEHIVIIGNGIAGVTLARHIRKTIQNYYHFIRDRIFLFENGIDVLFYGTYEV